MTGSLFVSQSGPPTREQVERFDSSSTAPLDVTATDWTRIGTAVLDPALEGNPFDNAASVSLAALFYRTGGVGFCRLRLLGLASAAQALALGNDSASATTWEVASGPSDESAFAVEARVDAGVTGRLELWTVTRRP